MAKKITRNTFIMENPPTIHSFSSTVGKKRGTALSERFSTRCPQTHISVRKHGSRAKAS